MSTTTTSKSTAPPSKPKKDREREKREKDRLSQSQSPAERLKIVVRRLPPNLPEEVFWQSVQTWITDDTVAWKEYYPGKLRKRLNKENIPSRAYVLFKDEEQIAQFSREYDGHLYRDKAGNESYAVVEFAPYQKVPLEKKKADPRIGTIEKDEDYVSFIESLNASAANEPQSLEALIAANQPVPQPKTTPLLEALKAEKAAQKEKETAIRQAAQQKRDEAKKKSAAATPTALLQANGPPMSKKAAKRAAAAAAAASAPTAVKGAGPAKPQVPDSPTKPIPKGPKSQRPPRVPGPPPVITDVSAVSAANGGSNTPDGPVSPVQRRSRPVIGLASRQFEAALNGAGVAPAGDRKSRRERAAAAAAADGADSTAPDAKTDSPVARKTRRKESIGATQGGGVSRPSPVQPINQINVGDGPVAGMIQVPAGLRGGRPGASNRGRGGPRGRGLVVTGGGGGRGGG